MSLSALGCGLHCYVCVIQSAPKSTTSIGAPRQRTKSLVIFLDHFKAELCLPACFFLPSFIPSPVCIQTNLSSCVSVGKCVVYRTRLALFVIMTADDLLGRLNIQLDSTQRTEAALNGHVHCTLLWAN